MFPRLPMVVCCWATLAACAAEEVDGGPPGSSTGNAPSASGTSATGATGGTSSTTGGQPSAAGTSSGTGNSAGNIPSVAGTAGTSGSGAGGGTGTSGSGSGTSGTSSTGGTPTISLPLSETFEDGTADGFMPWNEDLMPGEWAIVADGATKVYQPTAAVAELEFAVGGKTSWTDVALTVKVKLADAESGAQIVVRFKDAKTYLFIEMAEGKFKLRGRANGSTEDIVTPSPKPEIKAGTWYTVGVTVKGTTASLTLDGTPIGAPAMCDPLISNGGVALGVAEGSVAFDDLTVTAAP
ncbi:MAG: cellulose-binding protein [Polyangiaceae bacterium]|nr:cellulose-binding protein [Polyangiaceae bacterium]